MGTANLLATSNAQVLGTKAIAGAFVVILFILVFYGLLRTRHSIKAPAFMVVVGVIIITTLILLTLAVDSIINGTAVIS